MRCVTIGILFFLVSCKKNIEFSPHEVRVRSSQQNLNAKNIERLQQTKAPEQFRFIVTGDSQRFYEEQEKFVRAVNARDDISFVVINGDITDFGESKEFGWVADRISQLDVPFIGVIGNHDMLGNGKMVYNKMFGPDNFSFTFGGCKFVCLNTNSREHGFDGSLPDLDWLEQQLADAGNYRQVFVISHVPPFNVDFDSKLSRPFASLLANSGVHLSIHGHEHQYSLSQPYGDGVQYLVTGYMHQRHYVVVTVNNKGYELERVHY